VTTALQHCYGAPIIPNSYLRRQIGKSEIDKKNFHCIFAAVSETERKSGGGQQPSHPFSRVEV
jgi:hypothetical protein